MRVVRDPADLDDALAAARREAAAAFGDDRVYLERYLERPRHVEIQVLADAPRRRGRAGRARVLRPAAPPEGARGVALAGARRAAPRGDERGRGRLRARDRLPERGHGRVPARRARVLLPRAERADPGGAPGDRGRDRRRPRPRAAADRRRRAALTRSGEAEGHAVEVRLYAEHPRTFLPQAGVVERLRLPADVRVDAGVAEGDEVGTRYDPLIAKLIATGGTRDEALDRLAAALADDRGRRAGHEPPVPALARRAPGAPRGRDDDRLPGGLAAALRAARAPAGGAVARRLAAQPAAAPAPAAARRRRGRPPPRRGRRRERAHRADGRHGDPRARRARRRGELRASRSSCSRR